MVGGFKPDCGDLPRHLEVVKVLWSKAFVGFSMSLLSCTVVQVHTLVDHANVMLCLRCLDEKDKLRKAIPTNSVDGRVYDR